jgi:UDP-N-acetyl-2-amino-2-deoxyglucuronate dehydrogenase
MSQKLRVAFAGCGGMAAHYLGVYRDLDWIEVACCIDIDPASAQRAAATFSQVQPLATTDYEAALAPDIDVVVINTPNFLHGPQAIAAIEAGKHVLLQKPVAAIVSEARAIARAAEKTSKTVGLYMSYFDQPLMGEIRERAQDGRLGPIVNCYARLMHRGGLTLAPSWRWSLAATGGGCFIQLAVHYVHLFEWITGSRVVSATGFTARLQCPGIEGEDVASAILRLNSGALVTLDTAWCADGEELAVHGTRGTVGYRAQRYLTMPGEPEREVLPPAFGDIANPLNQHLMFLEAARDGRPAPVSIASGVHDMDVVAAVYESARTGRVVDVE